MPSAPELPTCIAMLLCESIYRDEASKNLIVVGTFNYVHAPDFPLRMHKMSVLFTMTGGNGEYDVSLSVEHEKSGHTLVEMKGPMTFADPLSINDFIIEMGGLEFKEEGKYWLVLRANEAILNQRPFEVIKLRPEETEKKP